MRRIFIIIQDLMPLSLCGESYLIGDAHAASVEVLSDDDDDSLIVSCNAFITFVTSIIFSLLGV